MHADMRATLPQLFIASRTVLKTSAHMPAPTCRTVCVNCTHSNAAIQQVRTTSDEAGRSIRRLIRSFELPCFTCSRASKAASDGLLGPHFVLGDLVPDGQKVLLAGDGTGDNAIQFVLRSAL